MDALESHRNPSVRQHILGEAPLECDSQRGRTTVPFEAGLAPSAVPNTLNEPVLLQPRAPYCCPL